MKIILELEVDEAYLLNKLAIYGSTLRPPKHLTKMEVERVRDRASADVFAASEDTMKRLAKKLAVLVEEIEAAGGYSLLNPGG